MSERQTENLREQLESTEAAYWALERIWREDALGAEALREALRKLAECDQGGSGYFEHLGDVATFARAALDASEGQEK